jgi:ATP-dependent Lon protease
MPGKGNVVLTGNMRNVMQESASTAVSFVRSKAERLHLDPEWLKEIDLHLHVPQHGTPKDGPSAGVTMFTAVASLLLGAPVKSDVAMTGEISLRGQVLPVGGVKEKLLAAHRAGLREVLIPAKNRRDLEDVPQDIKDQIKITLISSMDEVLPLVLEPPARQPAASADGELEEQKQVGI